MTENEKRLYAAALAAWQALVFRLNFTDTTDPLMQPWVNQAREIKEELAAAMDATQRIAQARAGMHGEPLLAELIPLREAADLTIRGFRRWKHNQKRGGDRNEADNGMTDLSQGIWELDQLLVKEKESRAHDAPPA